MRHFYFLIIIYWGDVKCGPFCIALGIWCASETTDMMGACVCLRTARESFLSYVCVADSHRSLSIDVVCLLISREGAPLAAVRCGALPPQSTCTI